MKPAKEIRVGNIIMVDAKPFIVLRSDVKVRAAPALPTNGR